MFRFYSSQIKVLKILIYKFTITMYRKKKAFDYMAMTHYTSKQNIQHKRKGSQQLQSHHLFYRKKTRRPSQLGRISQMIQLNRFISPSKNFAFKHHFRKNNNKIENNICNEGTKKKSQSKEEKKSSQSYFRKKYNNKENNNQIIIKRCQNFTDNTIPLWQQTYENKKSHFSKVNKQCDQNIYLRRRNPNFFQRKSQSQKQKCERFSTSSEYGNKDFQRIQNCRVYPRFKSLQLQALYRSLLEFSDNDPTKFIKGFQSALSYHKIIIKPEIIQKKLWQNKILTFQSFVETYKCLENMVFIQSIIDFVQIIFQPFGQSKMSMQTAIDIFSKRSSLADSIEITQIIFKALSKDFDDFICLPQIVELCQKDLIICSSLSKICSQDIRQNIKRY